ncbi:MAG TPA: hypothetical protein VMY77_02145 [Chitinophagaceae bacterium]|nr:hypothetical protein [Chitinophagaceae bacterium]
MRKIVFLLLISSAFNAPSQNRTVDSLKAEISKETNLNKKFELYKNIRRSYSVMGHVENAGKYLPELYKIAAELKNDSLLAVSYFETSIFMDYKTDSKEQINYLLKGLKIAEQKYPSLIYKFYNGLGSAYNDLQDYKQALYYLNKTENLLIKINDPNISRSYLYHLFALAFNNLDKTDSALHYANKANEELIKHPDKERMKGVSTVTGNIYVKLGNEKLAESYFLNSIGLIDSARSYYDAQAVGAYSKLLLKQGRFQSAKFYALEGLDISKSSQAKAPLLSNVQTLRKIYRSLNQPDSAYYYATLELDYRDSLFNREKLNAVQNMTFEEDIRQKEEAIKQSEDEQQRSHNLQYAAIAVALITFIILFLLLSRSIIVKTKFIEFFGVLGLLAVFEFINLFIHPYLAYATNDSPVLMLAVLIAIGALLIPLHHKLEKWITKIMVDKNKKIRLEAAKKTIQQLEG